MPLSSLRAGAALLFVASVTLAITLGSCQPTTAPTAEEQKDSYTSAA